MATGCRPGHVRVGAGGPAARGGRERSGRAVMDRRADGVRRPSARARANLESVAVHASLIAADSLTPDVVGRLMRHPKLAKRYLAVEGHRALAANDDLLPGVLASLADREVAGRSDSAASSLSIAAAKGELADPPAGFGVIRAKKLAAAIKRAESRRITNGRSRPAREEARVSSRSLTTDEVDDTDDPDLFSSPVGGGGFIGKWLKKMLSSARKTGGSGGGPPGADTPTHRTNSANRGAYAVSSTRTGRRRGRPADIKPDGLTYPEWDVDRKSYRPDWCTVREVEPKIKASATPSHRRRDRRAPSAGAAGDGSASSPSPAAGRRHRHRRRGRGTRRGDGGVGARRGGLPRQPASPA